MGIKFNAPIGDSKWGPFFIRLALGAYFVLAGLSKFKNLHGFVEEVQKFGILPPDIALLYGVSLPYIEVLAGVLLVIGFWTTLGALLASLMLTSFIIAIGPFPGATKLFNKDFILLAASISLLYTGGGANSVDRFRSTGS